MARRKIMIISGVTLMLAASLLTGTIAFVDFNQSAVNVFKHQVEPDVTLHDDFDGENKDVYVENAGTSNLYVRVRLNEYMQIGNKNMLGQNLSAVGAVTSRTRDKWLPHTYQKSDSTVGLMGNCGQSTGINMHTYYEWDMSGEQIYYKPGTPGMTSSDLDGVNSEGKLIVDADSASDTEETVGSQPPILMSDYIDKVPAALTAAQAGCWILDDTATVADGGGWAYWSKALAAGTATNLLLDEVKLVTTPEDAWYYTIDVKLQAATLGDTKYWDDGTGVNVMSSGAKKLVSSWG